VAGRIIISTSSRRVVSKKSSFGQVGITILLASGPFALNALARSELRPRPGFASRSSPISTNSGRFADDSAGSRG